jgi:hypothetical protein
MAKKQRVPHVTPNSQPAESGKSIIPFAANESETREAAESARRNPAEEGANTPGKDDWRTCPNANGPQPGDFGDRG